MSKFLLSSVLVFGFMCNLTEQVVAAEGPEEFRIWKHQDGRVASLKLLGIEDGCAVFQIDKTRIGRTPIASLSQQDQDYLKSKSGAPYSVFSAIEGRLVKTSMTHVLTSFAVSVLDQAESRFSELTFALSQNEVAPKTPDPEISHPVGELTTESLRLSFRRLAPEYLRLLSDVTGLSQPINELAQGLVVDAKQDVSWTIKTTDPAKVAVQNRKAVKLFLCQTLLQKFNLPAEEFNRIVQYDESKASDDPDRYGLEPNYVQRDYPPQPQRCTPVYTCYVKARREGCFARLIRRWRARRYCCRCSCW